MDLRDRLKEETRPLHDKIEQTFLLKKILQHEITLSDYHLLLQKFYGFIAPCEDQINVLRFNTFIENRQKKPWLEEDLRALSLHSRDTTTIPICINIPPLSEREQVLGYLYVMEGATLGGQIITKMLKTQLAVTQTKGGRFFYGYGDKTKTMWDNFCITLSDINDMQQQNKIIDAARNTFNQLYQWMDHRSLLE